MTTKRLFKWLQIFANKMINIGNIQFYDEVEFPNDYKLVRGIYKDYILTLKYKDGYIIFNMKDKNTSEILISYYNTLKDFRKEFDL